MSRFHYQETASVEAGEADAVEAVRRTLEKVSGRPEIVETRISTDLGSWIATRLLGAAFVPARWLPTRVTVDVMERGDHREVVVDVAERFGGGSMIGAEKRIRSHCQSTAVRLRDAVVQSLTADG